MVKMNKGELQVQQQLRKMFKSQSRQKRQDKTKLNDEVKQNGDK